MRHWKALTIALVLGVPPAGAAINPNDDRGFDPEKSYQFGDIDQVNLQSGMVSIHLPIGQRYPVAGLVEYGFTLSYSSGIWDLESFGGQLRALPNRLANAGTGWMVTPGLLLKPSDPSNDSTRWIYVSPDQGKHEFWSTLHATGESDGDGNNKVDYTRDGSYLRLRRDVGGNTSIAEIDFPDGRTHKFQLDPTDSNQLRLTQMRDPFTSGVSPANWVNVTYVDDAVNGDVWTFTDKHGRNQKVYFRLAQGETDDDGLPETVQVVDRIELTKFGGGAPAVYDFQYESEGAGTWSSVRRDCKDADGTLAGFIKVPQLSAVVLPDGTSWDMSYYYDNETSTATCRRGQIERIEYPTGGRIEYDYGRVHMPTPDGCWDPNLWESQVLTVYERTFVDGIAASNPSGTWNYSYWLNEDPDQTGNPPCETWEDWAAELMVLVTQPDGHQIENYFSVWPFIQDSAGPDPTSRFKRSEYGLPFTRNVSPVGGDRYLSSRVLDCSGTSCEVVRSEYVTYAQDGTIGNDLNEVTQHNRRLVNNRTVFEDDEQSGVPRFADTARTEFDGVGNFRNVTLTGNFTAGDDRLTITKFNPELVTWPNANYDLIDWDDLWNLGDYDSITSTEGTGTTHKAMQEFQFNATTGFLECIRTRKLETARSTTGDLIVKYVATGAGMIASESYFGGDGPGQTLGTSSICDSAGASAQYVINHGYLKGIRNSSQYAGVSFKHLDLEVDNWTSLPTSSSDSAGVETLYEYDSMGRLTKIDPQQYGTPQADAWTRITYGFSGSVRQVTVERCRQNPETCIDDGLMTQNLYQFDGLGRLYREKQRRHDGNLSRRITLRDEMGRPRRVSSWVADSETGGDEETIAATVYGAYDAFGRPLSATLPDGKNLTYEYLGARWVGTTRSVNTWGTTEPPTPGLEDNVTSWHAFDRQGRLWRIWEQGFWDSTPDGTPPEEHDPCYTHTDYAYDEGSRLISVDQYFWNPATQCDAPGDEQMHQQRGFSYDDRGFLLSEIHPEKGTSGNGTVTYDCFDSRGHARYRIDGISTRRTASRFDVAERLLSVRAPSGGEVCSNTSPTGTLLKEFVYDTATGAGAGKIHTAKRSQAVGDPLNQTVDVIETYTYEGRQGRPSTRSTQFKYGGVNGELWTFNTYYNILGGLAALDYPTCSGGSCGTGTNPPTAARQFQYNLENGWLDEIEELSPTSRTWATLEYHPNLTIHKVTHGASNVVEELGIPSHSMPRPASITVKKGANTLWASGTYVYDGAGNIKSMGTDRFRYDQVSRLIRAELREIAPDQYEDYVFDMFSNLTEITTEIVGSSPTTLNLPVQMVSGTPTNRLAAPHVYDAAGNMINGKGTAASFDLFNMISGYCTSGTLASCSGQEWAYVYTADDERVAAYRANQLTGVQKVFTIRDLGNRLLTRDEQRNDFLYTHLVQDYVWRGDRLLGTRQYSGGTMRHFGLDHLGTIRLTTDGSGNVTDAYTYRPFGVEATASVNDEPMRFTGHERDLQTTSSDPEDDVDYLHARFYGPGMGRFLSVDPVGGTPGRPQSWNRYFYAGGNPILFTDPDGREIYVQVHEVAGGFMHASLRIEPNDQERFAGRPFLGRHFRSGQWYATLGAGPDSENPIRINSGFANLESGVNRDRDFDQQTVPKTEEVKLDLNGRDENEVIQALFEANRNYRNDLDYEFFPRSSSDMYNSNSYVSGLIQAIGLTPPKLKSRVPGYGKPVPSSAFKSQQEDRGSEP